MNIAKWIQQVLREIFAIKAGKPTAIQIKPKSRKKTRIVKKLKKAA